jgi:hypothetical protein
MTDDAPDPREVPPPPERSQFRLWHLLLLTTDVAVLFWMLRLMVEGNRPAGPAGIPTLYAIIMLLHAMFVADRQPAKVSMKIAIVASSIGMAAAVWARMVG